MAVFNGAVFYSGVYFTDSAAPAIKTGTGGIDPGDGIRRRRDLPAKPLGLLDRPRKQGRKEVDDRVAETQQLQAEIASKLAAEFTDESATLEAKNAIEGARLEAERLALVQMTQDQIDLEIAARLKKKLQQEEDMFIIMTVLAQVV